MLTCALCMTLRLFDKLTSLIYQGRQIPVTVKSTRVYMIEHALNVYYCVTLREFCYACSAAGSPLESAYSNVSMEILHVSTTCVHVVPLVS